MNLVQFDNLCESDLLQNERRDVGGGLLRRSIWMGSSAVPMSSTAMSIDAGWPWRVVLESTVMQVHEAMGERWRP